MLEWLDKLREIEQRVQDAWGRLVAVKAAVWALVARHPELEADAAATFAAVRQALLSRSVGDVFGLVADAERAVADARAAYTSEADQLKAILAALTAVVQ